MSSNSKACVFADTAHELSSPAGNSRLLANACLPNGRLINIRDIDAVVFLTPYSHNNRRCSVLCRFAQALLPGIVDKRITIAGGLPQCSQHRVAISFYQPPVLELRLAFRPSPRTGRRGFRAGVGIVCDIGLLCCSRRLGWRRSRRPGLRRRTSSLM